LLRSLALRFDPLDFAGERGEAVGMPQLLGGRGRLRAEAGEPIPAPQPSHAVDDPLTGRQPGLQGMPDLFALDPTGLCESACERGRCGHLVSQRLRAVR